MPHPVDEADTLPEERRGEEYVERRMHSRRGVAASAVAATAVAVAVAVQCR